MTVRIIQGEALDELRKQPSESIHCMVTSPPYWGLRDYGVAGQLGLESTPAEYVENMVAVFREGRRVLRDDGTLWLNLGDSYATNGGAGYQGKNGQRADRSFTQESLRHRLNHETRNRAADGIKPKDLVGIPWRVAFALQADGWYLRQDIIWSKPNPMPESVRDRCTKAHEYLFLLAKSERYYFDSAAISEPCTEDPADIARRMASKSPPDANGQRPNGWKRSGNIERKPASARGCPQDNPLNSGNQAGSVPWEGDTRNKRSVWTVTTQPFKEAHFATFPPALIEPCILAGCPKGGTVLDPFGGAGTTGLVADRMGRDAILIELNPEYAAMAKRRITNDSPLFADVA